MKLSIIVPVFNEEKTLEKIMDKIEKVNFGGIEKEFIIVDDASIDHTREIISKLKKKFKNIKAIEHKKNMGKGAAIRTAIEHISGDIATIQDADLEYDPNDLKRMIKLLLEEKTEVIYGSRLLNDPEGYWIYSHYYGNKFLTLMTRILYGKYITDMETCYKMMHSRILKDLKLTSNGFNIEPEITAKLMKKGYDIKEIPIKYNARSFKEGKKINWRHGIQAIWALFYWRTKKIN